MPNSGPTVETPKQDQTPAEESLERFGEGYPGLVLAGKAAGLQHIRATDKQYRDRLRDGYDYLAACAGWNSSTGRKPPSGDDDVGHLIITGDNAQFGNMTDILGKPQPEEPLPIKPPKPQHEAKDPFWQRALKWMAPALLLVGGAGLTWWLKPKPETPVTPPPIVQPGETEGTEGGIVPL